MRLLYSASLVIMLIDILTRAPIKNAVILCNGKQNPYVSKEDGYYVFCNLSPGSYKIFIYASGYLNKEFETSVKFGESKKFILFLSFQSTNSKLFNAPRIEFIVLKDKKPLKNHEVKFISKTSQSIKLIQKIKKGDQEIILNVPENNFYIFQNFLYSVKYKESDNQNENKDEKKDEKNEDGGEKDKETSDLDAEIAKLEAELKDLDSDNDKKDEDKSKDKDKNEDEDKDKDKDSKKEDEKDNDENQKTLIKELLFIGYDRKYNAYILEEESDIDIPTGGNFYPYWNLQTDSKGKVVIPLSQKLMNDGFINFEISFDDHMIKRRINLKRIKGKSLVTRVNFKSQSE